MRNEKFVDLRKKCNVSQASLAEKLCLPVSTIRAWEHKLSIPPVPYMQKMAKILNVEEEVIAFIFKPEKIQVEEEHKKEAEIYEAFLELFWGCNEIEHFIQFVYLLSLAQLSGVICCGKYIFPFTKIVAEQYSSAIVLSDSSDNFIVLTSTTIIEVKPIAAEYDAYTLDLNINCPIFPTELKYRPDSFRQKIRLSFFNR